MYIIKLGFKGYSQQTCVFLEQVRVDSFGRFQTNNNENKDWYKLL